MRILAFLLTTLVAIVIAAAAEAETRVALIIGNGAYRAVERLDNPANDAKAVAAALRGAGFDDVTPVTDLDQDGFRKALRTFETKADSADWAVIYYAGHGLEMAGGNYLVPVDARLASDRDVADETVSLDRVLTAVEGARKLRLVVLDACRNNPFLVQMSRSSAGRSIGRGLARIEPQQATLVAYAAKAGSIAADGTIGANSPFAAALVGRLAEPGIEINKVFRLVREDVLKATRNQQEPFVYGSLSAEDFYFRPPMEGTKAEVAAVDRKGTTLPSPAPEAMPSQPSTEMLFWSSIAGSANRADFETYLQQYPNGIFAPLARNRLAALQPTVSPVTQLQQYVAGTWAVSQTSQGATYSSLIQYKPDGTFTATMSMKMPGQQARSQNYAGTWAVQPIDADRFTLTIAQPGEGAKAGLFRRVDENTVANEAEGYQARRVKR